MMRLALRIRDAAPGRRCSPSNANCRITGTRFHYIGSPRRCAAPCGPPSVRGRLSGGTPLERAFQRGQEVGCPLARRQPHPVRGIH
jgi:hypothetical protein